MISFFDIADLPNEDNTRKLWNKIEFLYVFLRDVAFKLNLEANEIRQTFEQLEGLILHDPDAMHAVLSVLVNLNNNFLIQELDKFECPITLEKMTEPVIASDGNTYERTAIERWFRLGHRTSPLTNEPFPNQELRPNPELQQELSVLLTFKADMTSFLEHYIFDVLLSKTTRQLIAPAMIEVLVDFLAEKSPYPDFEAWQLEGMFLSKAGRVGLLRELLRLDGAGQKAAVERKLASELRETIAQVGFLDTPLCVCYASVLEQFVQDSSQPAFDYQTELAALFVFEIDRGLLLELQNLDSAATEINSGNIEKVLEIISKVRYLITSFSQELICYFDQENPPETLPSNVQEMSEALNSLLSSSPENDGIFRSMRMFLLKQLERTKGVSFARNVLQQPPLSTSAWVNNWKQTDSDFVRFLGTNRLPQHNPLHFIRGFDEVHRLLEEFMQSGDLQNLGVELVALAQPLGADVLKGAMVAVLFHDVHLLSILREETDQRSVQLRDWLLAPRNQQFEALFPQEERRVLALFTGCLNARSAAHHQLHLDAASSAEAVLRVRLMAHAVSISFACPFFGWLRTLLLRPGTMVGSYFPTMPEDMTSLAQNAVQGNAAWWTCPNGHPYFVDACGRPMQQFVCADCGAQIGGQHHNPTQGNVQMGTNTRTSLIENYCLVDATLNPEAERFTRVRGQGPIMVHSMRLMMHAVMAVGLAAQQQDWVNQARPLFNRMYCNPPDMFKFIADHLQCNWDCLKALTNRSPDDVSLCLHLGLLSMGGSTDQADAPPPINGNPLPQLPGYAGGVVANAHRTAWEAHFQQLYFQHNLENPQLDARLAAAYQRFNQEGELGGMFKVELSERVKVTDLPRDVRLKSLAALWGFRRPFCFEHFSMQLNQHPQEKARYPVLDTFLQEESKLRSLSHLPSVFKWIQLLQKRYNRRLSKAGAREKTVRDVLEEVRREESEAEALVWEEAFRGYAAAWNLSWSGVGREGCLVIPEEYVQMNMELATFIAFCLPTEEDEGICPTALIRYLKENHNTFATAVSDRIKLVHPFSYRRETDAISSSMFKSSHAVSYHLQEDFIPFIEKRCVSVDSNGNIKYDFKKAETRLLNYYFSTLQPIELEVRGFEFSDEQRARGLAPLRQKVHQYPLPPEAENAIRNHISTPAQASRCLEVLETAINFLGATGGSFMQRLDETVEEMEMSKYLKDFLLIQESVDFGSRTVRLKHLESLWNLLSEVAEVDPFEGVSKKYCHPLAGHPASERLVQDIHTAGRQMNLQVLVPLLKRFITSQLKEERMNCESNSKEILGWLDTESGDYLSDIPWFQANWPDVKLKYIMSVYEVLQSLPAF